MRDPENSSAEQVLRRFDEQHTKYKFMESNLLEKKRRCGLPIPYMVKTLTSSFIDYVAGYLTFKKH